MALEMHALPKSIQKNLTQCYADRHFWMLLAYSTCNGPIPNKLDDTEVLENMQEHSTIALVPNIFF